MPDEKKTESEVDKMQKEFAKVTGMKIVETPNPPQGYTEYAKDKKWENGKP